jgi:hypothetical protein
MYNTTHRRPPRENGRSPHDSSGDGRLMQRARPAHPYSAVQCSAMQSLKALLTGVLSAQVLGRILSLSGVISEPIVLSAAHEGVNKCLN